MNSISKHQARVKDRMSALPDGLCCHILSFLPTANAVRTTILSTRWKNLWTSVTNLDFDEERDFNTDEKCQYGSDRFMNFVERALLFRDSSDIRKFRLALFYLHCLDGFSHIDAWICTAVRRNVVELDLRLFDEPETTFHMPQSLFTCKTLRVLRVWSNVMSYDPPTSRCFPGLKFLHVTIVNPDEHAMEKLFSCCSVLEDLTLDGTTDYPDDYNFKISVSELRTLRIRLDERFKHENNFYINAPKLENLDLKDASISNYFFENVKSLVSASISFRALSEAEELLFPDRAVSLLAGISFVKCLSLSARCLEARYLPVFGNLTTFKLVLHDCNYWELLAALLRKTPILKDLDLEDKTECDEECSELQWNPPVVVPACLSSHLKAISIRGFKGRLVDMEVAKYLLQNGYVLNKMTIYSGIGPSYEKEKKLYKEFLMFHRAMTCQVELIEQ